MNVYEKSLELHEKLHGKLGIDSKIEISSHDDLSLVYTPGVAAVCQEIAKDKSNLYKYTSKGGLIAVVTNGTAVLGLGNIGAAAGLPVMEGKCLLFKRFANIDAFPICVESENIEEFINIVKKISIPFGGINLEDIKAPDCFEIEKRLQDELDIPVFHDDQHGTAIVALAALINALKVTDKDKKEVNIVISGAGAAGSAICRLLLKYGCENILVCDSKGIIGESRMDLADNEDKIWIAKNTNRKSLNGSLGDAMKGADVLIGVSAPKIVSKEMVGSMNSKSVVFALANPEPEIMPNQALEAGALIIGTGRSDFGNQINNALAFPGVFKAALKYGINKFTDEMFVAAAEALANFVENLDVNHIVPSLFDEGVSDTVSDAIGRIHNR